MYKITEKVALNPTVTKMVIEAPLIAKKAKPGQFIIVRPFEDSERIALHDAGYAARPVPWRSSSRSSAAPPWS